MKMTLIFQPDDAGFDANLAEIRQQRQFMSHSDAAFEIETRTTRRTLSCHRAFVRGDHLIIDSGSLPLDQIIEVRFFGELK